MSKSESRRTDVIISVRMTEEERDTIRRAAARLVAHVPGARMAVSAFLLQAGLAAARKPAEKA